MSCKFLLVMFYAAAGIMATATVAVGTPSAASGAPRLQHVVNALVYPTSSERFFREGQQKFEREIIRFRRGDDPNSANLMTVDASSSQQHDKFQKTAQPFLMQPE